MSMDAKKIVPLAIAGVLAVMGVGSYAAVESSGSAQLAEQAARIASLQSELDMERSTAAAKSESVASASRGYDAARVDADEASVRSMLERIFTWNDFESYKDVRAALEDDYGVDANDPLLTDFFPLVEAWERNGVTGNDIDDNGLNMRFDDAEIYLTGTGSRYEYFAKVTVKVASPGGTEAERLYGVFFKTEPGSNDVTMPQGVILQRH